jgi:hypothetical protein
METYKKDIVEDNIKVWLQSIVWQSTEYITEVQDVVLLYNSLETKMSFRIVELKVNILPANQLLTS